MVEIGSGIRYIDSMESQEIDKQLVNEVIDLVIEAVNLKHINRDEIGANTPLMDGGLELDSVDVLETVVAVEHHFDVKVEGANEGKQHFRTIGTIANFVQLSRTNE